MDRVLKIAPHSPEEIQRFAKELHVSEAYLKFMDTLRESFILWEHDYIKSQEEEEPIGD